MTTSTREKCPECGSKKTIPIIYGRVDEDLRRRREEGAVAIGGCCKNSNSPLNQCQDCGKKW